jgi:CHASE3 domain sensor protein
MAGQVGVKHKEMKTKFIVILVVQSFLLLLMLIYSLSLKSETDKLRDVAVQQSQQAESQYNELRAQLDRCNGK